VSAIIEEQLKVIRERIQGACDKARRDPAGVKLIAVTKTIDAERIKAAFQYGIKDFGENYIQEARQKIEGIGREGICWHMIGHVQSNKAKYIPALFDIIHSVDRWELLETLDRYGQAMDVLFELNLSGEATKHGTNEEGLKRILDKVHSLKHLKPVGLMTMAPYVEDAEKVRGIFRTLRETLERTNRAFGLEMKELSMGISSDFEIAIEEGATMVRIGTAIFGERS
jgi:PLP dependent protein